VTNVSLVKLNNLVHFSNCKCIQDDHKKKAKQLKVAFDKNNELKKKINQLQNEQLNFRTKLSLILDRQMSI